MSSRYQGGIIRPGYNGLRVTCAPPSIVATAGNSNCACVSVGCPSGQCFAGVTSYTVYANCNKIANTSASSPIVVSGLTSGSSYSFRAVATNTYGPSLPSSSSNSITAQLLGSQSYTTPGTYSWVAPTGVTSVSVVAVGGGAAGLYAGSNPAGGQSYFCSCSVVKGGGGSTGSGTSQGAGGTYTGAGGGNGGGSNAGYGGSGAGGYSGNGGNGGCYPSPNGTAGSGGGGGGGGVAKSNHAAGGGGGVGLFGQGCSGSGGSGGAGVPGNGGRGGSGGSSGANGVNCSSSGAGGAYGGGGGGYYCQHGGAGGGLGYKNNITVTPGNSYTVVVGAGGTATSPAGSGAGGAVRIMWPGNTRTFPSTNVGTP